MSYTVDDYVKDYTKAHLHYLAPEDVLPRFSPDQRLQGLSPDDVLPRFSPDQRLQGLSPDQRLQGLLPEQRLHGLSLEEIEKIEAYLSKLKNRLH